MFCPKCGKQLADNALDLNFCPKCGRALRPAIEENPQNQALRCEYQDTQIPLGVRFDGTWDWKKLGEATRQVNEIILRHLQGVGQEGWEAEGITTFGHPSFAGRLIVKNVGWYSNAQIYESVTIRLKRIV